MKIGMGIVFQQGDEYLMSYEGPVIVLGLEKSNISHFPRFSQIQTNLDRFRITPASYCERHPTYCLLTNNALNIQSQTASILKVKVKIYVQRDEFETKVP